MAVFPESGHAPQDLHKRLMLDHISPEAKDNGDFSCAVRLFDGDSSVDSAVSMMTPVSTPDGSFETNFDLLRTPSKKSDGNDSFTGWDANLETPHSKLSFCISPESMCTSPPPKQIRTLSPITSPSVAAASPRRLEYKLNCLQLFDSPHTPKSIVRRSSFTRLQKTASRSPYSINSCSRLHMTGNGRPLRKYKSKGTNINPFTPTEIRHKAKGSKNNSLDSSNKEEITLTNSGHKRLALRDNNISRYNAEFHEVCKIGTGSFGTVYKCINRLDGCVYAVKKSLKPVAGSVDEGVALREVYAHAVLGSHPHLVRYYSAWAEDDHMIIQNEFCNGGNLSRKIARNSEHGKAFTEPELQALLRQIAQGLQYIHSMDLVHLDIKPENIFISYPEPTGTPPPGSCDTIYEEEGDTSQHIPQGGVHTSPAEDALLYKIGDMGHVTSIVDPHVEEGDCRYMCRELLQENFLHLPKADIFSLALSVYVSGGGGELPKNGSSWHCIRDGVLPDLAQCSNEFNALIKAMIAPDPVKRPTASQLTVHPTVCPITEKSKEQLRKELNEEKFKNQVLSRELQVAQQQTRSRRVNRSLSVGNI